MRFLHSGLATPRAELDEDARIAGRIGADGLEVDVAKLAPALERWGVAGVKNALRRHDTRAVSLATVDDVTFRDLAGIEEVEAKVHRLGEVGRALGATWIVATPGERPDGADERDAAREARATLERLARIGERYDVGIAFLPLGRPHASVRTVRQAITVVEGVGRRALGLAVDTFEAWAAGSQADDLKVCPPRRLAMVRAADAAPDVDPEAARAHHRREPGVGPVPVAAWLAVAQALAADVWVTSPVAGEGDAAPEDWARRLRGRTLEAGLAGAAGR